MTKITIATVACLLTVTPLCAQQSPAARLLDAPPSQQSPEKRLLQAEPLQQSLSLRECIDYALENNAKLQKDKLSAEAALQGKREVLGALLPQISASAGYTYNIEKTKITMPNFVNSMLPAAMQDPNAAKYMSVTMGTDMSANWGVSVSQQIFNYSLASAVNIAKTGEQMAQAGVQISTEDVIAQTATLYYNVQVLSYALTKFDQSIGIMEKSIEMMKTLQQNGIIKKTDCDQIQVAKTNLETEKLNLQLALQVQQNLLKLQIGYDVSGELAINGFDSQTLESQIYSSSLKDFNVYEQLPYKMAMYQEQLLKYQKKAAIGETLPVLVLTGTYSYNYLGDKFSGPTYQHFPVSMAMLNLKVPIFQGGSKSAKIKKANIELAKAEIDQKQLVDALTMANDNARSTLNQNIKAVDSQRDNKNLAEEVMVLTNNNYEEGIASLSDLLNANSSYIQAEMNYVNALNKCIKAYIDLKKTDGSIQEIL